MTGIAIANRLARDLDAKSVVDLTADARLEILDAINGALQLLHALSSNESKIAFISLSVTAPLTVTLTVTDGSADISGYTFGQDDQYRTIQISGDPIDNQIVGETSLLHPYSGGSGSVTATIYADAISLPEAYAELVGDPRILESDSQLIACNFPLNGNRFRRIAEPTTYWVEANAINQNPAAPALIRFDPMPDKVYRMQARALMAPVQVTFSDLLAPGPSLPIREEQILAYLLPVARGLLSHSDHWKNKETAAAARDAADAAEKKFDTFGPKTIATPNNRARTRPGF